MIKIVRVSVLLLLAALGIIGCAPSLVVKESKVVSPSTEKLRAMQISYRDVAMVPASPTCKDCKVASFHPAELVKLGELLVKDAGPVFAHRNIALESVSIDDGTKKKINLTSRSPVLLLTPTNGTTQTQTFYRASSPSLTTTTKKVSYVFAAQLIDLISGKVIWTAKIDGAAWDAPDSKSGYDELYAAKFLNTILDQMAKDGII